MKAFALLSTNASPAIPSLAAIADDTNRISKANRAAVILSYLGTEALPPLLQAMSIRPSVDRGFIADEIATHLIPTIDSRRALPLLLNIVNTEGDPLKSAASNAVWRIAPDLRTTPPVQ